MRCLFIVVRNLGYSSHFNTLLYETYDTLRLDIPREDLALQSSALVHIMIALHSGPFQLLEYQWRKVDFINILPACAPP